MIQYKWFYEPIYKTNYYYVVCKSQHDFLRIIEKHYGVKDIPFVEGCYGKAVALSSGGKVILCTWVQSRKSIPEFTHELTHTVVGLFDQIDHSLKHDNDEPIAALSDSLGVEIPSYGLIVPMNEYRHYGLENIKISDSSVDQARKELSDLLFLMTSDYKASNTDYCNHCEFMHKCKM